MEVVYTFTHGMREDVRFLLLHILRGLVLWVLSGCVLGLGFGWGYAVVFGVVAGGVLFAYALTAFCALAFLIMVSQLVQDLE